MTNYITCISTGLMGRHWRFSSFEAEEFLQEQHVENFHSENVTQNNFNNGAKF